MTDEILSRLSELTEEEQYILVERAPDPKEMYSRSGRFIIERRRISRLAAGDSTAPICLRPHPRFREFPVHSHDYVEIMYVCGGSVTHKIGTEEVRLSRDELIILGKDTRHSILSAGENDVGVNLIISTELFESMYDSVKRHSRLTCQPIEELLHGDGRPYLVFSAKENLPVRNIMESMIWAVICEGEESGYTLKQAVALLICYLASYFAKDEGVSDRKDSFKAKILGYVESSYSTATLSEAAEMLGLSPSYLCRLVTEYFGVSFKKLLTSARFDAACDLLSSTDMPIGEIINRVGYENSSYFHKEFKRRFGVTPNNYRKSL